MKKNYPNNKPLVGGAILKCLKRIESIDVMQDMLDEFYSEQEKFKFVVELCQQISGSHSSMFLQQIIGNP